MSGRAAVVALALAMGCGEGDSEIDARGPFDGPWPAADAEPPPDGPGPHALLRTVIEAERQKLGVPGVAVAIIEDGVVTFSEGFGVKWPNTDEPMDTSTVFVLGTATEPLTALGLLRLVDAGKVNLDAPVVKYVPELGREKTTNPIYRVTVRQLLTQSSGLADEPMAGQWPESDEGDLARFFDDFGMKHRPLFEPGTMYFHSTLAADLVGLIIEKVSGKSFADYMRSEVFDPLGMHRTTFRPAEVQAHGDVAWGTRNGTRAIPPFWFPAKWHLPCCLAYGSVDDLSKFARFLIHGSRWMSSRLHQEMISPQLDLRVLMHRVEQGYGLLVTRGYLTETEGGVRDYSFWSLSHYGGVRGNTVNFMVVPERKFAFVYAANRGNAFFNESTRTAIELLLEEPSAELVSDPVSRSEILDYVGTYHLHTGAVGGSDKVSVELQGPQTLHIDYPIPDPPYRASCDALVTSHGNARCPTDLPFPFGEISFLYLRNPPKDHDQDESPIEYMRAMPFGFCADRQ